MTCTGDQPEYKSTQVMASAWCTWWYLSAPNLDGEDSGLRSWQDFQDISGHSWNLLELKEHWSRTLHFPAFPEWMSVVSLRSLSCLYTPHTPENRTSVHPIREGKLMRMGANSIISEFVLSEYVFVRFYCIFFCHYIFFKNIIHNHSTIFFLIGHLFLV